MGAALRRDVVDSLEQIDVAPLRRESRGTKVCNAGDSNCRSDFVVYRSIKAAVSKLKARLIKCAVAYCRDVTDLDCLICVAQPGTAADCIQSTDRARIDRVDVVKTVTSR